ncbi:hypothetical protein [Nocardia tengchongensis]|uniref:hypothetical protein n=1 Tax=Nocardia tengchongensis TaxID=2055889 RepID=UPI0036BE1435
MDLTVRIIEPPIIDGHHDGRVSMPHEWRQFALAAAGDPGAVERVLNLSDASQMGHQALAVAAKRQKIPTRWPNGDAARDALFHADGSVLGQWRTICLGRREDVAGRVAHVDTTTLANAVGLIEGTLRATPATVIDLAGLINTLCVHDQVCFLENHNVNVTEAQLERIFGPGLFKELPVASTQQPDSPYAVLGDVQESLRWVYKARTVPWLNDVRNGASGTEPQQHAWLECWETLLGRPCSLQWLLRDPDEGHSTEYGDGWNSPTPLLLRDIVSTDERVLASSDLRMLDPTGPDVPDVAETRVEFAQMTNARALFNAHIADILGVRYAAALARVPILRLVERDTSAALAELLRRPAAEQVLQQAYGVGARLCARNQPDRLVLPFFAAEAFQRASAPSDLPAALHEVREKSTGFRSKIIELNHALQRGDETAVQEIRASLGPVASESAWQKAGLTTRLGIAVADISLAWLEPSWLSLNVAVALLGPLLDPDLRATIFGRSRVHYGLVDDMRPLLDSSDSLIRLWDPPGQEAWLNRMQRLSSLTVIGQE